MKQILTFIIVCTCILSSAQDANNLIDSLKQVAATQQGEDKVLTLGNLCWELGFQDPAAAEHYGSEALQLAQEMGDSALVATSANDLAAVVFRRGDYTRALDLNYRALRIRQQAGDDKAIGSSFSKIGVIRFEQGQFDSAAHYQLNALEKFEGVADSISIALTYNNLTNVFEQLGQFDLAIEYATKAYEFFQSVHYTYGEAGACGNLALLFEEKEDYDECIFWSNKALELFTAIDSKIDVANMHNNLGLYHRKLGNSEEGIRHYQQALAIDEETGDLAGKALHLANIGAVYVDWEKYTDAETSYLEALVIADQEELGNTQKQCYQGLANAYEGMGKWQMAYAQHKLFEAKKDSLLGEEKFRIVNELEEKYETERREKELALERALGAEKDKEIQKSNFTRWLSIGGLIAVLIVSLLLISRQRQRRRALLNAQQAMHQEELLAEREQGIKAVFQATEEERQRIAKDLHDGVGQQLSGIKLGLSELAQSIEGEPSTKAQKIATVADQAAHDVRSISHQMMPRALNELGLVAALDDMLNKSLGLSKIRYEFEHFKLEGKRFSKQVEIGLYRIGQELVNNIIKHSGAEQVVFQLFENKKNIIMIVEDNGRGFDVQTKKDGIGLQNISSRINTINGEVNWEPSPGAGTVATVKVPVE